MWLTMPEAPQDFESIVFERINILGPQEHGGIWEQSSFAVFRRVSLHINELPIRLSTPRNVFVCGVVQR
jgi:hypothetical protein